MYKARQDLCCCCFSCKAKDWAERARCSTKRRREQQYLQATNNKQINMLTIRHAMTHPTLKAKDLGPWPACKHNRCVDSMEIWNASLDAAQCLGKQPAGNDHAVLTPSSWSAWSGYAEQHGVLAQQPRPALQRDPSEGRTQSSIHGSLGDQGLSSRQTPRSCKLRRPSNCKTL